MEAEAAAQAIKDGGSPKKSSLALMAANGGSVRNFKASETDKMANHKTSIARATMSNLSLGSIGKFLM